MLTHRIDTNKNLEKTSYMHVLPEYLTTFSLILAVCGKKLYFPCLQCQLRFKISRGG
jgi:hypothetical protein